MTKTSPNHFVFTFRSTPVQSDRDCSRWPAELRRRRNGFVHKESANELTRPPLAAILVNTDSQKLAGAPRLPRRIYTPTNHNASLICSPLWSAGLTAGNGHPNADGKARTFRRRCSLLVPCVTAARKKGASRTVLISHELLKEEDLSILEYQQDVKEAWFRTHFLWSQFGKNAWTNTTFTQIILNSGNSFYISHLITDEDDF